MSMRTAAGQRSHAVIGSPIGPLTLIAQDGRLAGVHMEITRYEPDAGALGAAGASESAPVLAAPAGRLAPCCPGKGPTLGLPPPLEAAQFHRCGWQRRQSRLPGD